MPQDTTPTHVVFRFYKPKRDTFGNLTSHCGDVIALLYNHPGTMDPYTCSSFMHVGQHGRADPAYVISDTRLATPEEYADLKAELEAPPYGYLLEVRKRIPRNAVDMRRKALEAVQ